MLATPHSRPHSSQPSMAFRPTQVTCTLSFLLVCVSFPCKVLSPLQPGDILEKFVKLCHSSAKKHNGELSPYSFPSQDNSRTFTGFCPLPGIIFHLCSLDSCPCSAESCSLCLCPAWKALLPRVCGSLSPSLLASILMLPLYWGLLQPSSKMPTCNFLSPISFFCVIIALICCVRYCTDPETVAVNKEDKNLFLSWCLLSTAERNNRQTNSTAFQIVMPSMVKAEAGQGDRVHQERAVAAALVGRRSDVGESREPVNTLKRNLQTQGAANSKP